MTQKSEQFFMIPQSLAQAVADYLVCQPYKDVAHLVAGLATLLPTEAEGRPETRSVGPKTE